MKRLGLFLLGIVVAHAASDVQLFRWQESHDKATGEKVFGFFLAPEAVWKVFEANARGDSKAAAELAAKAPKEAWNYGILLTGEAKSYQKGKIALFEPSPCGSELALFSGTIDVDRKAGLVRVALQVTQDGKVMDFVGNGVYPITKAPDRAPETKPPRRHGSP